jgi:putative peptide zinc metalloprotease protein
MSSAPTLAPALPAGQAADHLSPKLRRDLIVVPQFYEGMTHYVVKEPIGQKFFRFKIEEYFLLQQFDGRKTLTDVKKEFERQYRPQTITIEDLLRFVSQLHEAGLVQVETAEQAKALITRRRKNQWKRVWQFFANILYIKIPIVDPERLLTWMYPYFRWIYTRTFVAVSLGMMAAALISVLANWGSFTANLPSWDKFFSWQTIMYFWVSLAVIKIIHEFGHGLTAKHFGGEVHEMGMLFLVLTPALYCDVTDSWMLPSKWKRIWISAAGIYVECFLAAIATFVWWNTEPGVLKSLMLATMFICSVNTILFNANPLLRYDGYYVMADWLEIPNLRIKSSQFFQQLLQDKVLGLEVPPQHYMPRSRRTLFVIYAIASYLYRWVVTFSILFFLYQFLKPYKLGSISAMLAIGSLIPLIVMPCYQMFKFVGQPGRMRKVKKARAAACFAAFLAAVSAILLIPVPLQISGPFVIAAEDPAPVYAEVPGRVVRYYVRDGDLVREGDPIAELSNLDKQRERLQYQQQIDMNRAKADIFLVSADPTLRNIAQTHRLLADELEPALEKVTEQISRLTLYAPRSGMVQKMPHPETIGMVLQPGEGKPLCEVVDPARLKAVMLLDQTDVDLVREVSRPADGSTEPIKPRAWLKVYGKGKHTVVSRLDKVAKRVREDLPPELSTLGGGEVPAQPDQQTGTVKPMSAVFEAAIPIDNSDGTLQPGMRGKARIDAGSMSLGAWIVRTFMKTFHFTL